MRLIDADELITGRVENDPVVIAAKCAPTVYDVDKVVEQLEEIRDEILTDTAYNDDTVKHYLGYIDLMIETVKAGGVNE